MTESAMNTTLAQVEHDLAPIGSELSLEQVLDLMTKVNFILAQTKILKERLDAGMLEWCLAHGDITAGSLRFYAGTKKTTKCTNIPATVEALLSACAGDFEKFCTFLSAGAVKYGAARSALSPEDYARLFTVIEEPELSEGKPKKTLQKINTDFVK